MKIREFETGGNMGAERAVLGVTNVLLVLVLVGLIGAPGFAKDRAGQKADEPLTRCELQYSLSGWSVFYKRAKGIGVVTCNDGQRADVKIKVHGGGLTFGKSRIRDGHGRFSGVFDIDEIFGSYGGVQAHAGVLKSGGASAVTKGEVSLALAGTGEGFDVGLAFSRFKIVPR